MASTPSASALSAVLRCRGNIWTRNPQTKRPASAAYSLGLAGGTLRDSESEWRIFPGGDRLVSAVGLSVSCSGQNALLRQLLFTLSSTPQGGDLFSQIIHLIIPATSATQRVSAQGHRHLPAGVLKLSITINSQLKVPNPVSSLTSLVSWLIFSKRQMHQQMKSISTNLPQENAQIHKSSENSCDSGGEMTHDPSD